ncbi:hypothetical protein C8A01DRAFT_37426 [Parachaetomium inaequale]|uniref:Uncharacterized protein n=1 Tax=Parachaetomium inaequale TaxID=2588326 RepID=A0AAN6SPW0_9PEZI|nr:hypothetical protein C8A01DRAFT_37426 [Parachaetomium inaequale]
MPFDNENTSLNALADPSVLSTRADDEMDVDLNALTMSSCRKGYYAVENEKFHKASMLKPASNATQLMECDEFPRGASEDRDFGPAASHSNLCIARIQNNHGGQCISLLNMMSSNVGKMEAVDTPLGETRNDVSWIAW